MVEKKPVVILGESEGNKLLEPEKPTSGGVEDTTNDAEQASKKEISVSELLSMAKTYAQPELIEKAIRDALVGVDKIVDKESGVEINIDELTQSLNLLTGSQPKEGNIEYVAGHLPESAKAVLQYYQDARQFWIDCGNLPTTQDSLTLTQLLSFLQKAKETTFAHDPLMDIPDGTETRFSTLVDTISIVHEAYVINNSKAGGADLESTLEYVVKPFIDPEIMRKLIEKDHSPLNKARRSLGKIRDRLSGHK